MQRYDFLLYNDAVALKKLQNI